MKINKHQNKKSCASLSMRIVMLFLMSIVLFSGYTLAKYFRKEDQNFLAVAKNFYFESDLLAVSTEAMPKYVLQSGVNTVSFSLMNYPDELRQSEVDIAYTVEITGPNDYKDSIVGEIKKENNDPVLISFDGQGNGLPEGTYVVTATSTSPYSKSLKGEFTIVQTDKTISYSISDANKSPILKLTITTTDYNRNVEIQWPDGVVPDNTDPLLAGINGNSAVIQMNAQSEYVFQFFKTNPDNKYIGEIDNYQISIKLDS